MKKIDVLVLADRAEERGEAHAPEVNSRQMRKRWVSAPATGIAVLVVLGCIMMGGCGEEDQQQATPESKSQAGAAHSGQDAFIAKVKRAVAADDIQAAMALGYWDGVPEQSIKSARDQLLVAFEGESPSFSVRKFTAEDLEAKTLNEITYQWNMKLIGFLVIKTDQVEVGMGFGEKDGKVYFAMRVPVK